MAGRRRQRRSRQPRRAAPGQPLQLVLPAGARGPAFLVIGEFPRPAQVQPSTAYALAVGHLADRIAGGAALAASWPADDKPLSRAEREELQGLLVARGLDTGGIDGIIGDRTRAAIRATQRALNLAEDGHPSAELLERLRDTRRLEDTMAPAAGGHVVDSLRWQGNCSIFPGFAAQGSGRLAGRPEAG